MEQGHLERAREIYAKLVAEAPDDVTLCRRMAELDVMIGAHSETALSARRVEKLRQVLARIRARRQG